jgi:hypothetical protein
MSAAQVVMATALRPTAATRDLNFSISAPVSGSKKFLPTSHLLLTDLTLAPDCDKFVSNNLNLSCK